MNKRGFTLVELLLALGLGALLTGAVYYFLGTQLHFLQKINRQINSLQSATIVMEKIASEIRNSDDVSYDFVNQKVRRKKGASYGYLTEVGEIKSLSFAYPAPKMVEIKIDNFSQKVFIRN